jgi:hypothetical protein
VSFELFYFIFSLVSSQITRGRREKTKKKMTSKAYQSSDDDIIDVVGKISTR